MAPQRDIFGGSISSSTLLLFLGRPLKEERAHFARADYKFSQIFYFKVGILFYFFQDVFFLLSDRASAGEQGDKDKNSFSFPDNLPDLEITV